MNTAPDRILVPVDLTDAAPRALLTAQNLAKRLQAEIVLVHVYLLPEYTYSGMNAALFVDLAGTVREAATRSLDEFAKAAGVQRALLREGDPAWEILKAIDEEKPALVVMGTHGRRGISRMLLGSVTERVLRQSPVPVVTVRMETPDSGDGSQAAPNRV